MSEKRRLFRVDVSFQVMVAANDEKEAAWEADLVLDAARVYSGLRRYHLTPKVEIREPISASEVPGEWNQRPPVGLSGGEYQSCRDIMMNGGILDADDT